MTDDLHEPPSRLARVIDRGATMFYRTLLVCYPRAFRVAHGADAASLFGEACRDDWTHAGIGALVRRVAAALVTVPYQGVTERRAERRKQESQRSGARFGSLGFWADLRYATRSIRRRPMISATIVGTLAIGIGANIAAFSVIDATLLRPSPYVGARRVVLIQASPRTGEAGDPKLAWARTWANASQLIERVEARRWRSALVNGAGLATRKRIIEATPGYLASIGAWPLAGRLLLPIDSLAGAPPVVVIAASLWRAQFGQRSDVVGATIAIDGIAHQIVGVASDIPSDIPGLTFSLATALPDASAARVRTVAWLRPGVTLETAKAEVASMAPVIDNDLALRPQLSRPDSGFWRITVFRTIELGLSAASLLLMAIAGVNVVNLLLAAGETRRGELGIRRALGASAGRIIRLLLVETVVLTLSGAAIGLGIAWVIVRGIAALDAGVQLQTQLERIRLDPVVMGYTVGVALVSALAVGLAPALRGARAPAVRLKDGATRSATRLRRTGSALVAVETGLSAVLLVVAGIVAHAFVAMHLADRGFDADRVLGVRIVLPADKYATPASRAAFYGRLVDDLAQLPDVERAGFGYGAAPPFDFVAMGQWSVAGSSAAPVQLTATITFVTPGYFALMGIPLFQGADFTQADAAVAGAAVQPAIVSRSLARRFWADGNAVGAMFEVSSPPKRLNHYRVIGVSGDVSVWGLLSPTCRDCDIQLYAPLPDARQYTDVLLRVRAGAPLPAPALRAAVARIDPDVPSDEGLETAEDALSRFIRLPRFTAALLAACAGLALVLVAVGLSAVVSHAVAQRTREMGIRLALGATPAGVRRLVVMQGLRLAIAGLTIGVIVAVSVTRFLGSILYGMSPTDPITLVGAPILLVAIALAAISVPALRATRVDPARTLRTE